MKQKVLILGGTGLVGQALTRHFSQQDYEVSAVGREAFESLSHLQGLIEQQDLLFMLAGANIGQRWTLKHKQAIWESRLDTTALLADALQNCQAPPKRIFCASAIGIYPESHCEQPVDETCLAIGDNELAQLGAAWERASHQLTPKPVILRFGVVLAKQGGALAKMLPAFKMGLGGPVAGGQQCMSWIALDDLVKAVDFLVQHPEQQGAFNLCSPQPINNEAFGRLLARQLKRPFVLPLPAWQLKLMFGEGAQVLTHSAAVHPKRLLELGFQFDRPDAQSALQAIL